VALRAGAHAGILGSTFGGCSVSCSQSIAAQPKPEFVNTLTHVSLSVTYHTSVDPIDVLFAEAFAL